MAPRTISALRPEQATAMESQSHEPCPENTHDIVSSWAKRRDRMMRRLEQAESGTPPAAQSARAAVYGIQRARAMADDLTCECFLDSEVGGGEDALMAAGGGENVESPDCTSNQRAVSHLECLLDQNG